MRRKDGQEVERVDDDTVQYVPCVIGGASDILHLIVYIVLYYSCINHNQNNICIIQ